MSKAQSLSLTVTDGYGRVQNYFWSHKLNKCSTGALDGSGLLNCRNLCFMVGYFTSVHSSLHGSFKIVSSSLLTVSWVLLVLCMKSSSCACYSRGFCSAPCCFADKVVAVLIQSSTRRGTLLIFAIQDVALVCEIVTSNEIHNFDTVTLQSNLLRYFLTTVTSYSYELKKVTCNW